MNQSPPVIIELLKEDPRYKLDAYYFVREALSFAQDQLSMGEPGEFNEEMRGRERHLTGQQLCEAIRQFAIDQYGFMALTVLGSWGIRATGDFGEIVYNMIRVELMKQSDKDRREDFEDVYDFEEVFRDEFEITVPSE
jgi:uncharacterized repeat protein (TIGR04138 family)